MAALALRPVLAPMLRIAPRPLPPQPRAQAVLVTSGNALAALPAELRGLPLLAVGDATAARARAAGFSEVLSAGGDAAALAELIASRRAPQAGPLLLASGVGHGLSLAADLRARGFVVRRRVAYATAPVAELPEEASATLRGHSIRAALFFSAATARAFAVAVGRGCHLSTLAPVDAVAISHAAAAVLAPLPWRRIRVASHPNQEAMLTLLT